MASHSSSPECEKACRKIHASWNQLNHLGLALALRTAADRRRIKETYKAMYGEDLVERLRRNHISNPNNEMCNILYMWMLEPAERDAIVARDAFECSVVNHRALIEIYTRRKTYHLFFTKQAYSVLCKRNLDQDIIGEQNSPSQRILVALAASHRSHHDDVSQHIAKCDAKRLYDAGQRRMGTVDEPVILEMFSKRSIPQLSLAFSSYKHIYGHDYTNTLKKDCCGEFEDMLRVVVKCIYNPAKYYSKMVDTSMKGPATDKRALTRVILGSIEVGMEEVKTMYEKGYGKKLKDAICELLPEDDYRDFLVALTNGPISIP
uniref:Annexin D8-like n=1 Tax=Ananas comosus var. bracteatus TaxID=296719 RepID=A0A6V7P6C7_ANACO|nr:unnamed protein product [Ananas comosus var. bracteatus]